MTKLEKIETAERTKVMKRMLTNELNDLREENKKLIGTREYYKYHMCCEIKSKNRYFVAGWGVPMANVANVKKCKENIYIIEPDGTRYTLSKEANEILKVY